MSFLSIFLGDYEFRMIGEEDHVMEFDGLFRGKHLPEIVIFFVKALYHGLEDQFLGLGLLDELFIAISFMILNAFEVFFESIEDLFLEDQVIEIVADDLDVMDEG